MNIKSIAGTLIGIALISVIKFGLLSPSKQDYIDNMIKSALAEKPKILANSGGTFDDFMVYQDGEDGVVFKYVFQKGLELDTSLMEENTMKKDLIAELKADAAASDIKHVLKQGIYIRYIYSQNDEDLISVIITEDDMI